MFAFLCFISLISGAGVRTSQIGIQVYGMCVLFFPEYLYPLGGISCGLSDCKTNMTSAQVTLGACYISCNPCDPASCQYQMYRQNGPILMQYLCGNDASMYIANLI